jgi:hypothetical protein
MTEAGFDIVPGEHPIVPVMLGDAALATEVRRRHARAGVYVIGFSYPVVPQGKARIRTQISAAHPLSPACTTGGAAKGAANVIGKANWRQDSGFSGMVSRSQPSVSTPTPVLAERIFQGVRSEVMAWSMKHEAGRGG